MMLQFKNKIIEQELEEIEAVLYNNHLKMKILRLILDKLVQSKEMVCVEDELLSKIT